MRVALIFRAASFVPRRSILRPRPRVTRPPISGLRSLPFARLFLFRRKGCRRSGASLLTKDEARQLSINFAKPPELLRRTPVTIRIELKREDWQRESGAKPLVLFLATSLTDYMCMPSGRCKID
jgi:hypothetical protein